TAPSPGSLGGPPALLAKGHIHAAHFVCYLPLRWVGEMSSLDSSLPIRSLLHPYERSRLFLAWLGVVLGAYLFLAVVVFALPLVILVWFFLQLHRAHLLG